jgi:DNA-binding NarL/FixJ family response regulator
MSQPVKYCPSCGKDVPFYTMNSSSGELDRCEYCSMEIHDVEDDHAPMSVGKVYVVEDTALIREMIKDIIISKDLAQEVKTCVNGAEFLAYFTRDLIKKSPPGIIMLDVVMPTLNGINTAIALRSVEKAFGMRLTPILFFTVKEVDDTFKKILKYASPAMYINKGRDASPEKMQKRIEAVINKLWQEIESGGIDS